MWLRASDLHVPPPGVLATRWADALAEDSYEVVAGLVGAEPAVVCRGDEHARAEQLIWPGTPVHLLTDGSGGPPGEGRPAAVTVGRALSVLLAPGVDAALVVADDVPDLPPLLLGKMFSALSVHRTVAACPELVPTAASGGTPPGPTSGRLVAVAVRAPLAPWVPALSLDDPDAVDRLRAAAPPGGLAVTPGWRRLDRATVGTLDPGLEGWAATRALLEAQR